MNIILLVHVFSCWFMTGVICLVQVLVYPNFHIVGPLEFKKFHQFHLQRITWIVAPLMLVELLTAIWIAYENTNALTLMNFGSVAILWVLTGIINVPTHNTLDLRHKASIDNLSFKNWPRTIVWLLRTAGMFWLILERGI